MVDHSPKKGRWIVKTTKTNGLLQVVFFPKPVAVPSSQCEACNATLPHRDHVISRAWTACWKCNTHYRNDHSMHLDALIWLATYLAATPKSSSELLLLKERQHTKWRPKKGKLQIAERQEMILKHSGCVRKDCSVYIYIYLSCTCIQIHLEGMAKQTYGAVRPRLSLNKLTCWFAAATNACNASALESERPREVKWSSSLKALAHQFHHSTCMRKCCTLCTGLPKSF